jgi:hypothetical protein
MTDNKQSSDTIKPQQPVLCANNCGFYGNPLTNNFCSKCFKELKQRQENSSENTPATPKVVIEKPTASAPIPIAKASEKRESSLDSSSPSSVPVGSPSSNSPSSGPANRCFNCNKKVGLGGFQCRCGNVFCSHHRHADQHNCTYDYKSAAREQLVKANPLVTATKVEKI